MYWGRSRPMIQVKTLDFDISFTFAISMQSIMISFRFQPLDFSHTWHPISEKKKTKKKPWKIKFQSFVLDSLDIKLHYQQIITVLSLLKFNQLGNSSLNFVAWAKRSKLLITVSHTCLAPGFIRDTFSMSLFNIFCWFLINITYVV